MSERLDSIRQLLNSALNPTQLEIIDDSHKHIGHAGNQTGAGHYTVIISSKLFSGKTLLESHRMIYAALANLIPSEIHALKIKVIP